MAFKAYFIVCAVILWNLIQSEAAVISKYVHCMDVKGDEPSGFGWGWGGFGDDDSKASCPSSGNYIMTSCSARVNGSARIMGGVTRYDEGKDECVAYTDDGESYNQAIARCCNLTDYGSSFQRKFSGPSGDSNGDTISVACDSSHELIGCTGDIWSGSIPSSGALFDGIYSGNNPGDTSEPHDTSNQCTAQNGIVGPGVYAGIRCYDKSTIDDGYDLNCSVVWGERSNDNNGQSSVSCVYPNDFMTSCSAYSPNGAIHSYQVDDTTQSCVAKSTSTSLNVYANAICCNMTKTVSDSPTSAPIPTPQPITTNPSEQPTLFRTSMPTNNPSETPTRNPSSFPSNQPTSQPTSLPTDTPSQNPSLQPTPITTAPTTNPSNNPTINPSISPSINPTTLPSAGPSVSPTQRPNLVINVNAPTASDSDGIIDEPVEPSTSMIEIVPKESNTIAGFPIIPMFIAALAVLFFCICFTVCLCKCRQCLQTKSSKKYETKGFIHQKANSRSVMKHPIGNNNKDAILQLSKISSISQATDILGENEDMPDQDIDEATGTGTGSDPMTFKETNSGGIDTPNTPGNLLNDEFIIEDDNEMDIVTPGSNDQLMSGANALMVGNDDEVITGSDETPNDTTESDEKEVDDEIVMMDITMGNDVHLNGNNDEIIIVDDEGDGMETNDGRIDIGR